MSKHPFVILQGLKVLSASPSAFSGKVDAEITDLPNLIGTSISLVSVVQVSIIPTCCSLLTPVPASMPTISLCSLYESTCTFIAKSTHITS